MATRKQEIEHLAKLMKKIDIAMLATVGKGGHLVSRPLSTQCASFDGERVWFLTEGDTPKVGEIRRHPKVNVAYASKDANTYLSVAGEARVLRDQALIDTFWNDAMKAFFPRGKDDPNLMLIEVDVDTVEYWDGPGSWIGKALTFAVARVTGNDDVMGENRIVDLRSGRSRKPPSNDTAKRGGKAPVKKAGAKKSPARKKAATKAATKKGPTKAGKPAATQTRSSGKPARKSVAGKR
ncbi:MAG: pyridoxamine 5'-phosphate oxidase family protein [Luteimonas sp.]|nr:pyridoxamine 5'-phosphate oxidase family protein [Luteimonas sp.]